MGGLEEITPAGLVFYVRNFTNWDLVGSRMKGEEPVPPLEMVRYGYEACEVLLSDTETKDFLYSGHKFDLLILDGAYPECALGFVHHYNVPFMYINTVGFYTGSISLAGSPTPYSVTPFLALSLTDNMNFFQRTKNTIWNLAASTIHSIMDLEDFIRGSGDAGFIYFSMGSSVRAANMPNYLRRMLMIVFKNLPQRVLWKYEAEDDMPDLPTNVKLGRWLPQQDILAFVTHGGLLSMFETVYHGVPIVSLPVFCDHDSNAAKAEKDGYALKLDLSNLTAEKLLWAIKKVIYDPKYRKEVKKRQILLMDQLETPLQRAIYWTEYVLRHRGASHLQSPSRNLGVLQYYLIDVALVLLFTVMLFCFLVKLCWNLFVHYFVTGNVTVNGYRKNVKVE
ncbi:hypothetical protein NQ314_019509 [Rhamnusium bicolor]|uniref:UDP-glucuronosyltransferase n=1 Tax=Rhamnusium bicolor TaxID=1586634 RepID=A0AAV8WP95_9CUCU|nr:hypothetical protein NQ314_019509 [Rhamnusium bicolor]